MGKFVKYRWVIGLHLALMLSAYLITPVLTEDTYCWHYRLVALAWLILPVYLTVCFWRTKAQSILLVFSLFALNNLVDELFFDPYRFSTNEFIFLIVVVLIPLRKLKI